MKLVCLSCAQTNRLPADKVGPSARCGTCGAALFPDAPVDVDPATLAKAARLDGLPLVADFWAPWCGPCRMMAPDLAKAAKSRAGRARFVKLNTQDHPESGQAYAIRGIPTLVVFADGRERERQSGAIPAQMIEALAQRHMTST